MNDPTATSQTTSAVSDRAARLASIPSFQRVSAYIREYSARGTGQVPGCDFTFGNPHQMPADRYVNTLRDALTPQNDQWFAYQTNGEAAREAAAQSLHRLLDVPFRTEDIYLTTGGFAAIALALKTVADPGDEIIYSLPPWFLYEPLILEAGLVPVKVKINTTTFDLDLDAIEAAITERTRAVIVNSPNNPTGRIYPPELLVRLAELLEAASARLRRRIYLISDEAYNRIVFDGLRFHSPVEFYPHTLLAYSYGKTHLSPGQRVGYLALPPTMPQRDEMEPAITGLQVAMGWVYPNALLQHALPELEKFTIDVGQLQRRRDRLVDVLGGMGYRVRRPEGTFYLYVTSPISDDEAFTNSLARRDVFVLPGVLFETPGFFRISLTANEDMIERSLPAFEAAMRESSP
ncbi:aminotransferase class I/II-fold pyridoxal phosphate-dependent enzyme [Pseudarthrobacter cellobiosi]|uniref:aminotransferase class I/II-fold pyridoxal phosphate-dependent enzyme n=1 Tax=Pseudarthrobacter cellobiosi TaxID=2953654 RepID=UPI00208F9309|nr:MULTISPECIES: aminotransferase class I/II-fold pyridoxal phosphate-dependent enzyme [unclassified Pseudarthrobacter]MCO4257036.1 aminotransferase class I/II-fold pyridoxal phosphate-dependent enzyme [Pseudarthrobacter sp. HLT1-5]MCO4274142.1 aminotransferase class I/II-fold pyridoxal phosphate-dependent enzyme [Pseudarthrobacter sp. HLT3-5]